MSQENLFESAVAAFQRVPDKTRWAAVAAEFRLVSTSIESYLPQLVNASSEAEAGTYLH